MTSARQEVFHGKKITYCEGQAASEVQEPLLQPLQDLRETAGLYEEVRDVQNLLP
jgi:hypothetical protein